MLKRIQCDEFKTFDGAVRPPIEFHKGLNAVIGNESGTNSVGKSTFLMILDFVFGGDDYIRPRVCNIIMRHKVQRFGIEKNNGGDFFSTLITNDLRKLGYRCNITTHNAPTNKSKRDRILACQNEIKGIAGEENTYRLYFKSDEARKGNEMYSKAMNQLYNWNQNSNKQKTQHDDMPDSLAGLITNVLGGTKGRAKSIDASRYL